MCYTRVLYAGCNTTVVRKQIWPFENADCHCSNIKQLSPRPGVCRRCVPFARPQLAPHASSSEQQDTISNQDLECTKDLSEHRHSSNFEVEDTHRSASPRSQSSSPDFCAAFQAYIDRLREQSLTFRNMTIPRSETQSISDADLDKIGWDKEPKEDRWQVLQTREEEDEDKETHSSDERVSISEVSSDGGQEYELEEEKDKKTKQCHSSDSCDSCSSSDFDSTSDWVVFDLVNTQSCDELAML